MFVFWSTRPTTVQAVSDRYFHTFSFRPSQNIKVKQKSLPPGTVGWSSGSLMIPVMNLYEVFACNVENTLMF